MASVSVPVELSNYQNVNSAVQFTKATPERDNQESYTSIGAPVTLR